MTAFVRDAVREALEALPQVTAVDIERETVIRVTVIIDSTPFLTKPRVEVYEVEEALMRRYPDAHLDFRLMNPREGAAGAGEEG